MTRRRKILVATVSATVFVVLTFLAVLLMPGYLGIAYHNQCIDQAESAATRIDVKLKTTDGDAQKTVTITDPDQMRWLLSRLRLSPQPLAARTFHACAGNLAVSITTPDETYSLSYDHGNGMSPIFRDRDVLGFITMDQSVCAELNSYFEFLGFSQQEMTGCP